MPSTIERTESTMALSAPQLPPPLPDDHAPRQIETEPLAVWSLVLGVLFLGFGVAPFILARRAKRKIDASKGWLKGKGLAQAGQILGLVGMVFWTILLVVSGVNAIQRAQDRAEARREREESEEWVRDVMSSTFTGDLNSETADFLQSSGYLDPECDLATDPQPGTTFYCTMTSADGEPPTSMVHI